MTPKQADLLHRWLPTIGTLIAIGIAWGVLTASVHALTVQKADRAELAEIRQSIKDHSNEAKLERDSLFREQRINRYIICEAMSSTDSYCKGPRP